MHSLSIPSAGSILVRHIVEHIEKSSTIGATREHDIAIGQFLHLGFITLWRRRGVDGAERMPCASEVVGINHAVTARTCTEGSIKSVVFAHLDATALTDATTPEEERLHRTELTLVEKSINRLCYFCWTRPSATAIRAVEHCHAVGILTRRSTVTIHRVARDTNHHHFIALAVGYDGSIAITALATTSDAIALCQYVLWRPRLSVVVRQTIAQVNTTKTDVCSAGTIVTHGDERTFSRNCDGRNAIRHHVCQSGEERLLESRVGICHFWRIT